MAGFEKLECEDKLGSEEDTNATNLFDDVESRRRARLFQVAGLSLVLVVILFASVVISTNLIVKSAIQSIGAYALGVEVDVGSVALSPFWGRSSIRNVEIRSPEGFDKDLMQLGRIAFDLSLWAVVGQTLCNSDKPLSMEEFIASDVAVNVHKEIDQTSNVRIVLDRMMSNHSGMPKPSRRLLHEKVIVGRLELANVTASVRLGVGGMAALESFQPTGPVSFTLKKVVLEDVGKEHGGVTLQELIKDVVQAVLSAVITQCEGALKDKLTDDLRGAMDLLSQIPHAKEIYLDAGQGLEKAERWADKMHDSMKEQMASTFSDENVQEVREEMEEEGKELKEGAKEVIHNMFGKIW